ncbi:type II toxin-antitoxin system HicA family toxin [Nostoc sp. UHCC 0702]|nr:type II toxin-antitoxin system HicA family toxin [Nostoc sp. UHCC 0702]
MGASFTPELKKMLLEARCYFERQGKEDHEIWYSPITDRRFVVDGFIRKMGLKPWY